MSSAIARRTSYSPEGAGTGLMLQGISWQEYDQLLELFAERPLRMTYDQGALEIMTLSSEQEWTSDLLRLLIYFLGEYFRVDMACLGLTPFIKLGLLEDDVTTFQTFRDWLLKRQAKKE